MVETIRSYTGRLVAQSENTRETLGSVHTVETIRSYTGWRSPPLNARCQNMGKTLGSVHTDKAMRFYSLFTSGQNTFEPSLKTHTHTHTHAQS